MNDENIPVSEHFWHKFLIEDANDCMEDIISELWDRPDFNTFWESIDPNRKLEIKTKIREKVYEYLKEWAK